MESPSSAARDHERRPTIAYPEGYYSQVPRPLRISGRDAKMLLAEGASVALKLIGLGLAVFLMGRACSG